MEARTWGGLKVTFGAQVMKFILQTGILVLLGRLLVPEDFGLVAMAAVVVNFVALFKDAGLAQATVQRAEIKHEEISSLFWLNLLLSGILALGVCFSSPFLAWFFGDPRLIALTCVLSIPLALSGINLQPMALLQRNMRFREIAVAEIAGLTAGGLGAIALALSGYGYWALAGMQIGQQAVALGLTWLFARWKPGRFRWGREVREMLDFGLHLSGFNIINYLSRNTDKLLIGRVIGAASLGQYTLAYRLLLLPISQINAPLQSVLLPALSRLQKAPSAGSRLFLTYVSRIALLTAVPIATAALWGEMVVVWLLGEPWREAGMLLEWLAIAAMVQPFSNLVGLLFVVTGRTRELFRWSIFATIVTVAGFVIGLRFGVFGIAASYALTTNLLVLPCAVYATRAGPVDLRSLLRAVAFPVGLAYAIAAASFLI